MSNEMDAYRLEEALERIAELYAELETTREQRNRAKKDATIVGLKRIAELEKAFSLLIAMTVNGRIIKGRVGDYYQPQVPVAEIDNARKALKESGE